MYLVSRVEGANKSLMALQEVSIQVDNTSSYQNQTIKILMSLQGIFMQVDSTSSQIRIRKSKLPATQEFRQRDLGSTLGRIYYPILIWYFAITNSDSSRGIQCFLIQRIWIARKVLRSRAVEKWRDERWTEQRIAHCARVLYLPTMDAPCVPCPTNGGRLPNFGCYYGA